MIPIVLNSTDRAWATKVGKERWRRAKARKSDPRFPNAKEVDHIDGAGGELAFSRVMRLPWPASIDSYTDKPDVYPNWEVRTLRRMRGVKVADEDAPDRLVVWVRGQMPTFQIMGYIRAGGAKARDEWRKDPGGKGRPVWLVPEYRMVPIEPGFHSTCGYGRDGDQNWRCVFCGADVEAA